MILTERTFFVVFIFTTSFTMHSLSTFYSIHTVFAQAKLLNLKQITTLVIYCERFVATVFAQAKLLNLKQITTLSHMVSNRIDCICTSKVTKFKANNNALWCYPLRVLTVFAQAKLLNLKQITTSYSLELNISLLYLHKQSY